MSKQFRFNKKLIDTLPPHPEQAKTKESEYSDTEVAGLRLIVNRRGRKYFLLRYTINGAKRSMKLGDYPLMDVAEARQRALEHRGKIAAGTDPQEMRDAEVHHQLTFREFVTQDYLPHAFATKRSAKDDESRLRLHILPVFGDLPLAGIGSHAIQQLHDRLRVQKCAATANRHLALLKRALGLAVTWGKLDKSPVRGIRLHQENNQRQRYLSGHELSRFLMALKEEPSRSLADALRLLLVTGARREEVLQARWDEIDLDRRQWFLPKTKSGKSRFVLLNDTAVDLLYDRPRTPNNPYVFPGKNPGQPICNPYKGFQRILHRAGIKDLRIHDLRHSFASLAINHGASLYEVQHLLGHADSKTTQRYAHLASDRLRDATAYVSAIIQKAEPVNQPAP
jgi:integrase